jgi:hypothetical protein
MKERLLQWLNVALMVDLFLVLFSFVWLAAAVAGRAAKIPLGLDLWYRLWEPVFTPALGILMGGALLSGALSWVAKRWRERSTGNT